MNISSSPKPARLTAALILILMLTLGSGLSPSAAQAQQAAPASGTIGARPQVSGEIRKIDSESGKLTIRHAEIPNLEMPKMTMVFHSASPALLNGLKAGDQVRFTADRVDGVLTVMTLEPAAAQ
jgi:Cu/Ag efflux protein CusF